MKSKKYKRKIYSSKLVRIISKKIIICARDAIFIFVP